MPSDAERYIEQLRAKRLGLRTSPPSDAEKYIEGLRASGMLPEGLLGEAVSSGMAEFMGQLNPDIQERLGRLGAPQAAELQRARALWEEDFTGELNYGPDDPRIQPALVKGQYELVDMQGNREMVGQPRRRRSITRVSPREAMSEGVKRGDKWVDQPPITLEQIKAGLEAGVITWVEAQELLKLLRE